MSNPASCGIHLTKEYYKDFLPTDLQWSVAKVDDDFTLYDLFRLVYQIDITMGVSNIAATMGMSKFDEFWDQINLDRDTDSTNEIAYLKLYWGPSYDVRTTNKTGRSTDQNNINGLSGNDQNYWDNPKICEMPNLMSFHGIGPGCSSRNLDFHECGDDCPKYTQYAVEFTPVNNMAHLPIRVSPKVEFFPPYVESDKEFHRTGFELTIEPTLWCFITSIFWELTFAGSTPDIIADRLTEISDRVDEAKTHMEQIDEKDDNNPSID